MASDAVIAELLERFNIPWTPVIFRGYEANKEIVKYFVEAVVEIVKKVEDLFKTNTPMVITSNEKRK